MSKKTIILTIAGTDISFDPTPELYGEYMGQVAQGNMLDSAHNFVMQSASEDGKPALRELFDENTGAPMQVAGVLMQEYAPKVAISVKK
ncbi:putative phage tail assembly chaperone [Photobacterium ganghwense]|uniref:putative phage tail assembly chaperone n=1 Tax=Photobacterium ganghwense TaxID=320778 RepID=UPI001C2D4D93|nr:putative phage tail assembly chaperone [Photobacterium ganghwense]MBV1843354.1 putative phage tail assembly chaperone [Photobacterium ganghwense]